MKVFEFVEAEKANFSIKFMCERIGVTRQGFYAWRKRPPCHRRVADVAYTAVIKKIHAESRGNYGAPWIHAELVDDYRIRCGRKRVARLMRQAGLVGCHRRRKVWTTRRDPDQAPAPDALKRDFTAQGPNRVWVADIKCRRGPGSATSPRSSTCSPGASSGGRSPTTCAPTSSSTPSTWPSTSVVPCRG